MLEAEQQCYICETPITSVNQCQCDGDDYNCPVCGHVVISRTASSTIGNIPRNQRYLISGYTRQRTERRQQPEIINSGNIAEILSGTYVPQAISDKMDLVLEHLERRSRYPGQGVVTIISRDYSIAYCQNHEEFHFLLKQLENQGLIEYPSGKNIAPKREIPVKLTFEGWKRLDEQQRTGKRSKQAFVAMSFSSGLDQVWEKSIEPAIRESGFDPLRVDRREHNEKICDLIISEIRKSHFLVADFTQQKAGVYFEAGYAMGLGIPVIWTCREGENIHFDTRQYNHIFWKDLDDLRERLVNRIGATIQRPV